MNNTHEIGHQGEAISLHFLAYKNITYQIEISVGKS